VKKGLRNLLIMVLFLIWIPYFITVFYKSKFGFADIYAKENVQIKRESLYWVEQKDVRGTSKIALEEYLVGSLASTIPVEYEKEALKAQAILLRSTVLYKMQTNAENQTNTDNQTNTGNRAMLDEEQADLYRTNQEWKQVWGEDFYENYEKCRQAVSETEGMVLMYEGNPIPGTYTAISTGKTRNLSEESFPYLKSANCPESMEAADYLQVHTFDQSTWDTLEIVEKDENGYVLVVKVDGKEMTGERFRQEYHLPSSGFRIHTDGAYIIETKGKGHGMGMDQYYANYMAKNNDSIDYVDIISYFYENVTYEKIASYKN